jgi:hypothetical protein
MIFSYLDTNNFGAFGGDNSIGSGPPSRGGSSQRGGNRGGGGGGVSDTMMDCMKISFVLFFSVLVDHQVVIEAIFQVIVEVDTIQVIEVVVVVVIIIKVIVEDLIIIIEEVMAAHHRM